MTRILAAAILYFLMVFGVGFVLGAIRVVLLEPRLGSLGAVLCEAPLLLAAIVIASRIAPRVLKAAPSRFALLSIGLLALALQQVAEFVVGVALRGLAPSEQIAHLATAEGTVYAILLVLFAIMPFLTNRAEQ
jgi:hypothetical protein